MNRIRRPPAVMMSCHYERHSGLHLDSRDDGDDPFGMGLQLPLHDASALSKKGVVLCACLGLVFLRGCDVVDIMGSPLFSATRTDSCTRKSPKTLLMFRAAANDRSLIRKKNGQSRCKTKKKPS
jgi:hypothetical protein